MPSNAALQAAFLKSGDYAETREIAQSLSH